LSDLRVGQTTLINDIELFADGDTPSGRHILINGQRPPLEFRYIPRETRSALITQHTTFRLRSAGSPVLTDAFRGSAPATARPRKLVEEAIDLPTN